MREQAPATDTETLIFEQPLSERCARSALDFCIRKRFNHNEIATQWGSRPPLSCCSTCWRSVPGTFAPMCSRSWSARSARSMSFSRDRRGHGRLKTVLGNLVRLRAELHTAGSAFLQPLRDSEFLSAIKHRTPIPGAPASSTCRITTSG